MGIDRRILPLPQTFEAKLVFVIGERSGNVYGEEQRYNLTDHVPSLLQIPAGADARVSPAPLFLRQNGIFECKDVLNGSLATRNRRGPQTGFEYIAGRHPRPRR